ncbi:hypothetical protein [Ralstonia pseudosolanacearum]|uniref:hypothetical protein n=1 Tax=Ralstonia pseudosolanacearum TaxID=1310165 RepID=UPI003AAD9CD2
MLAAIRTLFGGRRATAAATDALPPEAQTVIASATVLERAAADEKSARLLVQTARGSFFRDDKQPRAWLAANWALTEAQTIRALKLIDARVVEAQREQAAVAASHGGERWADWRPQRSV